MTTVDKYVTAFIGAFLAVTGFITALYVHPGVQHAVGDINGGVNYIQTMSISNGSIQVGPQNSVRVLATSTARTFAELSATTTVYCNLSDVAASNNGGGVALGLGQPFIISSQNLYVGSLQCEAPASTTLSVTASQ